MTYCYFHPDDLSCQAANWLFVAVLIMVVCGVVAELIRRFRQ